MAAFSPLTHSQLSAGSLSVSIKNSCQQEGRKGGEKGVRYGGELKALAAMKKLKGKPSTCFCPLSDPYTTSLLTWPCGLIITPWRVP